MKQAPHYTLTLFWPEGEIKQSWELKIQKRLILYTPAQELLKNVLKAMNSAWNPQNKTI